MDFGSPSRIENAVIIVNLYLLSVDFCPKTSGVTYGLAELRTERTESIIVEYVLTLTPVDRLREILLTLQKEALHNYKTSVHSGSVS